MTDEITYTSEDAEAIFYGDHDDFEREHVAEIDHGDSRWHSNLTRIVKRTATGDYWAVSARVGLTEMQDSEFEDEPTRVERREIPVPATTRVAWFEPGTGVEIIA
jgi:hypothetical protein